jgi:mono/diheme cytochrome c family protein
MNVRALTLIGTAAFALACGGGNDKNTGTDGLVIPQKETCTDNPYLAGCPPVQQAPDDTNNGAAANNNNNNGSGAVNNNNGGTKSQVGSNSDTAALAKAAAENVLKANCGQCHGPQGNNSGNMNYIDDIDKLVENGKITPLDSANSKIIKRMKAGEMPPTYSGLPPVTTADIDIVAQYIDNPQFWGKAPVGNCADSGQLFDFDALYKAVERDLNEAEDADDALNYRYLSLTNRFNAGICKDTALDLDRQAVSKLVNMLSIDSKAKPPEAIDTDRMIFRVDLRDYGWDRAISVNGQNFNDVWEAIIQFNQYAVPFTGTQADDARQASGTDVPVMFADSMLDSASIGNLYYAIVGIDVNQNADDFILNVLGIDQQADLDDRDEVRAGTTKSRISRQDRVVERHDQGNGRSGVMWQSFDFNDAQNESIFQDPFNFNEGGREIIFTQPNGLMAFAIVDEAGNFVEDSDILLDTQQNNFRAITSISCSSCHATGFIPVIDEVGPTTLQNAIALQLNRDEIEELEKIYPSPTEFASIISSDTSAFYQRALDILKLPTKGGDPVTSVFLRFDRDMTNYDAAGDLGLTPAQLVRNLRDLNPALQVLDGAVIDRDDFTQFYVDSLCILSQVLENAPDADVCAAAAADVAALNQ